MKFNLLFVSFLFLTFFISTGFIFSTHSSIDSEKNAQSQTTFVLQDTSKTESVPIENAGKLVEGTPPRFKGGYAKFYKYIVKNLKYPENAIENGREETVSVNFVVDKDGSIIDVEVEKSIDPELDAEAIRVVKNSPKWKPAFQRGKYVKARMNIPIVFKLTPNQVKKYKKAKNKENKKKG